jgi:PAS domain-containing protein
MILNWMQKMGAVKTALTITVISILGTVALEIVMSVITGELHTEMIIKCIVFPGIIAPIISYAVVRVAVRLAKSEAALRESEEKYRQLVNHAPAGIYEIDFNQGKFVSVNDVICEYTGYTRQELLTMSALDILTEDSQQNRP